jgi:lysyl-tRNA synthetase, class I
MMSAKDAAASLREVAEQSNAWPFEEARKIVTRLKKHPKDEVIFETGYGPSGLPHIGTFGEVARTTMVRHAFRVLTDDKVKTRLIAFSDDMDGLRKVPDNVPNKDMLEQHLGKPLTKVPDPFGTQRASASTTTHACAVSSITSDLNTNSCPRPNATSRGASMQRCSRCWRNSTR